MTGKADRRRPLAVAIALIATIAAGLIAPVMIGARRGEPIPGTQVRADSRESVAITAPLTLTSAPSVTIEEGTVALAATGEGESRVAALLRTLVMGSGADLVLADARIVIDRRSTGQSPLAALTAAELAPVVAALSEVRFRTLSLVDTTIVLRTAYGSTEKFSNVDLDIRPQLHGLVNARGNLEYRGEPVDIDVTFTAPAADVTTPVQVKALLNGKLAQISFNGRLAEGERSVSAPNAELTVPDLRSAASWLGVSWPSGPGLGAFTAKGNLKLDERMISFEHAEFVLDGNAANGALVAKLGPERAAIEGTLAFATFDVAPYATPVPTSALSLASDLASDWVAWIKAPGVASLSFLRDADADVRFSAANLNNGGQRLGRLAASLSVKGGKAYGEIAEFDLDQGGNCEGQFSVDVTGSEPRVAMHAALNDVEFSTIAARSLGAGIIEGVGDLRLDVTAKGTNQSEILDTLAGTISLDLNDGGLIGFDIAALPKLADVAAPSEQWGDAGKRATSVEKLTARFTAVDGVLTAETLEASSEDRAIKATGTIAVDSNALDLMLSVTAAPEASSAGRPTGSYRVRGPWSSPTISRADPGKAADTTSPAAKRG